MRSVLIRGSLCLLVLLAFAAFEVVTVSSRSMVPTLEPGDLLLVDTLTVATDSRAALFRTPARGDLVVYRTTGDLLQVKRVLGLPREHVRIEHDRLFVDGAAIAEPYVVGPFGVKADETWPAPTPSGAREVVIPANRYFVLGDNRLESVDSRHLGAIPAANIVGVVRGVWHR